MSQLACTLSAQLYLAPGIMSRKWAAGHLSREDEQRRSSTAGEGAGRPLLDPSNHLFGEELLYFALSVLLWIFEIAVTPIFKCRNQSALQRHGGQVPSSWLQKAAILQTNIWIIGTVLSFGMLFPVLLFFTQTFLSFKIQHNSHCPVCIVLWIWAVQLAVRCSLVGWTVSYLSFRRFPMFMPWLPH